MTAPITILTLAIGSDFKKSLVRALDSKRSYAARHGYIYREGGEEHWDRERPIPWSKIPFVLSELARLPEGALIWLSDADVLITNPALRIEDQMGSLLPDGKDMLLCIDSCGHINSGNILMRNTSWTRDYWKRVGEQTDLLYHIWWENAAMIKLLETVPDDLAHTEITNQHKRFNAYLRGLPGQGLWEPGDWLVHFAGVYSPKEMNELIDRIERGEVPRLSM
jgi:hypothetical protein